MNKTIAKFDDRKIIRSEKSAKECMWNHYRDNKTMYCPEIRIYRSSIIYELMRVESVHDVFLEYWIEKKVMA